MGNEVIHIRENCLTWVTITPGIDALQLGVQWGNSEGLIIAGNVGAVFVCSLSNAMVLGDIEVMHRCIEGRSLHWAGVESDYKKGDISYVMVWL